MHANHRRNRRALTDITDRASLAGTVNLPSANEPPAPWRSDRHLDADIVRSVLQAQFPELAVASVAYVSEGWDSQAFLVDDRWIFRFPKRAEVAGWLVMELRVLAALERLGHQLQTPRPRWLGRPDQQFPYAFMGYACIPGETGDLLADPDAPVVGQHIGAFLAAVHTITADQVGPVRRIPDEPAVSAQRVITHRDAIMRFLPPELEPPFHDLLSGTASIPPSNPGQPVLVHADLTANHLIMADRSRITGCIDWGDSGLGDPAFDFGGVALWLGREGLAAALAVPHPPRDPAFADRAWFYGRCMALCDFRHFGRKSGDPVQCRHLLRCLHQVACPSRFG
jgi:aminoglycoside phosphotransferase (APT) family kinase protein